MFAVVEQAHNPYEADQALMRRVAAGDPRAQRVLAQRLAPRIQRLAARLLSGHPDADDAAQNALVEVLKSAHTYAERARLERWADRVAARTILRFAREQRRPWRLRSSIEVDDVATASNDEHLNDETPKRLTTYLARLSDQRREVLMLKHGLDYTTEEIAELVGAPVGTVKDRLVAARKQLRKLIQRDQNLGVRQGKP